MSQREAIERLRALGNDLNRGAAIPNLAEKIWDECDLLAALASQLEAAKRKLFTQERELTNKECIQCGATLQEDEATVRYADGHEEIHAQWRCLECDKQADERQDQLEAAEAKLEAAAREMADLRKTATGIYRGFENESLNGVVCSIPDSGIGTRPHRTWCPRCQRRWLSLKSLGESGAALASEPQQEQKG